MFSKTTRTLLTARRSFVGASMSYKHAKHAPKLLQSDINNSVEKKSKDSVLSIVMQNKNNLQSVDEWMEVRKEILGYGSKFVDSVNIDALMIGFCTAQKKYDLACSYVRFLQKENIKLNLGCIGKYFTLLYSMHNDDIKPIDEDHVISLYKQLRNQYEVLDTITCEAAIDCLSFTRDWKECIKLIGEIKIMGAPSAKSYSSCISAAFLNNEDELGWNLFNEMLDNDRLPSNSVYLAFLKRYETCTDRNFDGIEKLFNFLKYNDLKLDIKVAFKLKEIYGKGGHVAEITNNGLCKCCNETLEKLNVKQKEFEDLKKEFFENVIIGKNVFCKTRPEEVDKFKQFVSNMGKVDVVVDGLNVAYSKGVKKSPQVLSNHVAAVVRYFKSQNKNVLLLGRKHMSRWPQNNWSYIVRNAKIFLTEDLSHDDPYLLYCALTSGLNTAIVSRDLMRAHKCLLKTTHQRSIFSRWYAQNQYNLLYIDKNGKAIFKLPLPYMWTAQKQGNTWHIPFEDNPTGKDIISNEWLCLS